MDKYLYKEKKEELKKSFLHTDIIPFSDLSEDDKNKDYVIVNNNSVILGKAPIDLSDRPIKRTNV